MKIRKTARASSWPVFSPFGPALMAGQRHQVSEVLDFWFVQSRLRQWFAKDPAFDALLRERFLGLTRRAIAGELDAWNEEPSRGLALVLLLDQFPRQFWRDTAMAFAGDLQALALSLMAVERGRLEAEDEQARRQFWLMPLMHSEDLAEQEAAPAAVRAVQRSPHRRLRPPAPGCDRPLWPLPPPQCCSGAGVERGGAGLPADAGLPLLKRLLEGKDRALAAMAEVANDFAETPRGDGKGQHLGARWLQMAQSTSCSPFTRLNSLTLWLTTVAPMASAWQAIQRSLAPMGVARRFRAVA